MKRDLIQLITLIPQFSELDIAELAIYNSENELVVSGETIYALMNEYLLRYCYLISDNILAAKTDFIFGKWKSWLLYRKPDLLKVLEALTAEYDPLSDYRLHEEELKRHNDGEDTTTTKNTYDYTTTDSAKAGDLPTYSNYVTTFDNTVERLESKRQDTGSRETHVVAADEDKNVKTTEYTHTEAEMTVGSETVSADKIDHKVRDLEGHIKKTAQELTQETIDLYKASALHRFIDEFFSKYTFYVGSSYEGRCFL